MAQAQGNQERAQTLFQESADALRSVRDKNLLANPVRRLGYLALRQSAYAEAAVSFAESLHLNSEMGERLGVGCCLAAFAALAVARGQPERAARLFGAMQTLIDSIESAPPPQDQIDIDHYLEIVRARLAEAAFDAAWAAGCALTLDQAVALALETSHNEHPGIDPHSVG